jgi:hypothetical protein
MQSRRRGRAIYVPARTTRCPCCEISTTFPLCQQTRNEARPPLGSASSAQVAQHSCEGCVLCNLCCDPRCWRSKAVYALLCRPVTETAPPPVSRDWRAIGTNDRAASLSKRRSSQTPPRSPAEAMVTIHTRRDQRKTQTRQGQQHDFSRDSDRCAKCGMTRHVWQPTRRVRAGLMSLTNADH